MTRLKIPMWHTIFYLMPPRNIKINFNSEMNCILNNLIDKKFIYKWTEKNHVIYSCDFSISLVYAPKISKWIIIQKLTLF